MLRGLDRTVIAWHTSAAGCQQDVPANSCAIASFVLPAQPPAAALQLSPSHVQGCEWHCTVGAGLSQCARQPMAERVLVFWCCCYSGQHCAVISTCTAWAVPVPTVYAAAELWSCGARSTADVFDVAPQPSPRGMGWWEPGSGCAAWRVFCDSSCATAVMMLYSLQACCTWTGAHVSV